MLDHDLALVEADQPRRFQQLVAKLGREGRKQAIAREISGFGPVGRHCNGGHHQHPNGRSLPCGGGPARA